MENKDLHIDQFFADKLHDLQGIPNDHAVENIFRHLDQTKHPIDFALNKALSDIEAETEPFVAMEYVTHGKSEIDLSLYQRLKDYESEPDREFTIEKQHKKRRAIWLWFGVVILLIAVSKGLFNRTDESTISYHKTNQSNNHTQLPSTEMKPTQKQVQSSKIRQAYISRTKINSGGLSVIRTDNNKDSSSEIQIINNNFINEYTEDFRHLTVKHIRSKIWQFGTDINFVDKNNTFHRGQMYRRFPVSFHLQLAYLSENGVKNQIESGNQHKDATDLFSESIGKRKAGMAISFTAEHQLSKNWKLSTGFNYTQSSSTNQIDYYYTDIPVYDTTGALKGYFVRPRATSNHTEQQVISNSSSINIPLNIQYRVIPFKQFNIWLGIGCQIAMKRMARGEYFNFKTEQLSTVRQTFKKGILPQMSLGIRYPINRRWQLSGQLQVARQQLSYQIFTAEYRRIELIPSFNIGLIYTPFKRIK